MTIETRRAVTLLLKNKRLAFVNLAEPRSVSGGNPSYSVRVLLDPKDPDVKLIEDAMLEVATTKWKDKAAIQLEQLAAKDKVALLKREYRSVSTGEVFAGFEGTYNINASAGENKQPVCFDNIVGDDGKPLKLDADGIRRKLYSGCYAHVKVEVYPYDKDKIVRINCGLMGVMFAGDGEPFGGGSVTTADDFAGLTKAPADAEDLL
jgi:hypothetical protein